LTICRQKSMWASSSSDSQSPSPCTAKAACYGHGPYGTTGEAPVQERPARMPPNWDPVDPHYSPAKPAAARPAEAREKPVAKPYCDALLGTGEQYKVVS
jgi:hypothetical protein